MHRHLAPFLLISATAAHAQIVNGDFETGAFPPWSIANTPGGTTIVSSIGPYDIDGPGPRGPTLAASFMVGRNTTTTSAEGIVLSQTVLLTGDTDYNLSAHWSVNAFVNVYDASGGIFELMIDGVVLGQAVAPTTVAGQHAYGPVFAAFHAPQSGTYTVAMRITRNVPAGEEVVQFVDNIFMAAACYANCDRSAVPPILNANDFQCFLGSFAAGNSYANCDQSTAAPVLNANDFQCFLNAFAAGCGS